VDVVQRPYEQLVTQIQPQPDRLRQMQVFVDLLWEALHPTGVSWLGFYLYEGGDELVLGPRRDKPACSPIGLHGVCGQAFTSRRPIVAHDVKELGAHYIACDPRDRSELVIPCFEADGRCWAVLDLDSYDVGAFSDGDAEGLTALLVKAGLSS
jgi:putative methionine-R-sulfoxide reductase with GAF domain